ncbi:hypothetical protein EBZ80_09525 [bacterium]|nr:hypothetical protein [bacterium]
MKLKIRGKTVAIQLMLLSIFAVEAREKWMSHGIPEWFTTKFAHTWLVDLPGGLDFSWYLISIIETVIAVAALVSIARGEFLGRRDQTVLRAALMLSIGLFIMLGFGGRVSGDHAIAAHSFMYFTGTMLSLFMIERSEGRTGGRPHRRGGNRDESRRGQGSRPGQTRAQNPRRDSQNHQPRFVKNRQS